VAELAGSMLCAAPLLAVLTVPVAALLGIDPTTNTQGLAYLYGMALLGTWTAVIPQKAFETRPLDSSTKRLIALAGGLFVGTVSTLLGQNLQLGYTQQVAYFPGIRGHELIFFGALFALTTGWWRIVVRDRKSRFRLMPILWTAVLSALLTPFFWPYAAKGGSEGVSWDGIAMAVLIATAVQLISPWNKAAALYAQYLRASKKQNCKGKAVRC
jgi:hypothetical protein